MIICFVSLLVAPYQDFDSAYKRMQEMPGRFEALAPRVRVEPTWLEGGRFWYRANRDKDSWEFVLVDAAKSLRNPAFDHAVLARELGKATGQTLDSSRLDLNNLEFDNTSQLNRVRLGLNMWERTASGWKKAGSGKPYGLPPLPNRAPSRNGGTETSVTFNNQLKEPVSLFWVNTDGTEVAYGQLPPGASRDQHTFAGHVWLARANGKVVGIFRATENFGIAQIDGARPEPPRPVTRPMAPSVALVARDHNLFLKKNNGSEIHLTTDGTAANGYRGEIHLAPGGKHVIAMRTLAGQNRTITLVESSPNKQLQQQVKTIPYPKPGDTLDQSVPRLFDLVHGKELPLDPILWENPWSNDHASWSSDGSRFRFVHNRRGHQLLRLVEIEAATGKSRILINDSSHTFIDYAHKFHLSIMEKSSEILWMSERDGWNHIFLHDLKTGKEIRCLTPGKWVVRSIVDINADKREILVRAMGFHPGQDPYHEHLVRIDFEGHVTPLTDGDGTHTWTISPDGQFLIANWSRVDHAPVCELRNARAGKKIIELERGTLQPLERVGWRKPERFTAKARDGTTDIWGVIFRPKNFDPQKRHAVLEEIYAGPQGAFVPKAFRAVHRPHQFTELGFIVVKIDGMGTNWRSKAFHDVCAKNLADSGFPDRIAWMRAAAKKYPYMDLDRVGIFGGSAGGQSALRALLSHGDFYKAAAADCGCHDNRIDKVWWNELWMGWPIGPHYEAQAAQTDAHKLKGTLLLTVGELDTNVDPACTLRVVDALVTANKEFDFLLLPGKGHGAGESPFAARRRAKLFFETLGGPR